MRSVGAELFHVDRRTDVTKLTFHNFAKAPKSHNLIPYRYKVTVRSEIHTKHIAALCSQNAEFLFCKSRGT